MPEAAHRRENRRTARSCAIVRPRTTSPSFGSFKVPYTDDMSVLQALQTIKDTLDGTLSLPLVLPHGGVRKLRDDDQRQAAARLQHLPPQSAAGPDHDRAAEQLPDRARPRGVRRRFRQEDREHLSLHHPEGAEDRSRTGPISRPPRRWPPTNRSATASTACCATRPARNSAKIRTSSAPAPWRCCSATTATRATAARQKRLDTIHGENGVWSCTAVGICSEVCPKHVDPANAVNQNKTNSAFDFFLRFLRTGAAQ